MSRVAVLGLGAMGLPIALRLAECGHETRAWNRTPGRADLAGSAVRRCATVAEATADAEFVLTVVADDAALRSVLAQVLDPGVPGVTVLNLGTVSSATVRELAALAAEHKVDLVDAGMLGNAVHAGTGELRFYLGGDDEQVALVRGLLGDLGKEITHVGPLGAGMDLKLVLNLVMGLEMQALGEATALGESLGLSRRTVLDTISGSGFGAPVMRFKSRRMIAGRYGGPDFRLALMTKDLDLAVAAANGAVDGVLDGATGGEVALPMSTAARDAHRSAVAAGWGEQDCAAIADALAGGPATEPKPMLGGPPAGGPVGGGPPGGRPASVGTPTAGPANGGRPGPGGSLSAAPVAGGRPVDAESTGVVRTGAGQQGGGMP
jgi:3-hydroxyisobutyrate dehydrogenase